MRKFSWVVPVVVTICLIGYFLVWPWLRDRGDTTAIESLTAELKTAGNEIDKAITEVPEQPTRADLERATQRFAELNKQTKELVPRIREIAPKLKGDVGKQFREAQDEYLKKVDLMGTKITEVQKRIGKLKAK